MAGSRSQGEGGAPGRVTVWAVPLRPPVPGRSDGDQGLLGLEGGALDFRAETDARSVRIPLAEVARVKSVFASPVLMVEHRGQADRQRRITAFYFVKPPPLAPRRGTPEPASTKIPDAPLPFSTGTPSGILARRKARFTGMTSLAGWNRVKKGEVRRWRDRIRRAVAEARKG